MLDSEVPVPSEDLADLESLTARIRVVEAELARTQAELIRQLDAASYAASKFVGSKRLVRGAPTTRATASLAIDRAILEVQINISRSLSALAQVGRVVYIFYSYTYTLLIVYASQFLEINNQSTISFDIALASSRELSSPEPEEDRDNIQE